MARGNECGTRAFPRRGRRAGPAARRASRGKETGALTMHRQPQRSRSSYSLCVPYSHELTNGREAGRAVATTGLAPVRTRQ